MKKAISILATCAALSTSLLIHPWRPRHHSYVQGGNSGPGSAVSTITCQPNSGSGSVTAGNTEVMSTKSNGGPPFTGISSIRVTTWNNVTNAGTNAYWYGTVTSSGAETISVTLSSNLVTSVCGEYSTNTFDTSVTGSATSVNITTTKPNADIVCTAGGGLSMPPFTGIMNLRETGTLQTGPNGKLLLGDVNESTAGTYACSTTGAAIMAIADFSSVIPGVRRHR